MAEKDRKVFFNQLEEHSKIKLKILIDYVKTWMRKVVLNPYNRNHSCLIVDTFAGIGKYNDGSLGSPLLIINEAIDFIKQAENSSKMPIGSINLIFIEADASNYSQLKKNIEDLLGQEIEKDIFNTVVSYKKLKIAISNDTHENFINDLIASVDNMIPSFIFIDPFGFKLPFSLNRDLLKKYTNIELLINFMYEEIGRFIEVKSVEESMKLLFGVDDLSCITETIKGTTGTVRREAITGFYKKKLLEAGANFSLDFDIKKGNGRFKMCLIYATKNLHGFDTMKTVLNKMSSEESTEFEYTVNKNKGQMQLIFYPKDDILIEELAQYIFENFKGEVVLSETIKTEIMKHDYIPSSYYTRAMQKLNSDGKIERIFRDDGRKVKSNCFPKDCNVKFKDEIEVEV